jgi:glycosyltransferase involved in cell wall biosynthesis
MATDVGLDARDQRGALADAPRAVAPRVSIVTPSFNQAEFIAETIDTVLSQDYPHIEYLVVDGGSTDGTLGILRGFGDRVKWISEPDRGQSDAINKGWRRTTGEIIAWLNADDLYRPGAVSKAVAFLREHPNVDMVYGDCDYLDADGNVGERYHARPADGAELLCSPVTIVPQPATFLRRRVLQSVGYLDETLHNTLDFDYWVRVAARHRIAYLPECLAGFRLHAGSKTVRLSERRSQERLRIYEQFFKAPDLPPHIRRVRRKAMSTVHTRIANHHFLKGDMKEARQHALAGWRYLPWTLQRTQLKVLVLSLTGARGVGLASRLGRLWR